MSSAFDETVQGVDLFATDEAARVSAGFKVLDANRATMNSVAVAEEHAIETVAEFEELVRKEHIKRMGERVVGAAILAAPIYIASRLLSRRGHAG